MPFSSYPDLGEDSVALAALAARHCRLPHPDVVARCSGAVFPTIRDQKNRLTLDEERQLLLDDNVTPRWALFWAHGMGQTHHPRGWTIAHVWGAPKDPDAYTNLANLCLMPECLASLSDKDGPLGAYLQYHAYTGYGWHPKHLDPPPRPEGFEAIDWAYFDPHDDPTSFIRERLMTLNNQRVTLLRPLMGITDV
jgi:hypothetical protein